MDRPPEPPSIEPVSAAGTVAKARWMLPKLPVLIGVIGLGAAIAGGTWAHQRSAARRSAEVHAIQAELASLTADADQFRTRLAALQWDAAQFHHAAESADERSRGWAQERARLFDALVARVAAVGDNDAFEKQRDEIAQACAQGDVPSARERLLRLPEVRFPSTARFRALQDELYLKPLAQVSRQNPSYYREFKQHEPEAAATDIAALRAEIAATNTAALTPQSMLRLELYSAVAPATDPYVEDWATLSTAGDYFENPDQATLSKWLEARRAIKLQQWQTVAAAMQAILRTTVKTRLPFRAAYAKALLKNQPDDPAAAFPYQEEAAAAGDPAARQWVADAEIARGNPGRAVAWLEQAVAAGDPGSEAKILELYAKSPDAVPRDAQHEVGVLQHIVLAPDAPPLALMLLARLYEQGDGVKRSSQTALAYYRRAAEKRHPGAALQVARCFLKGQGTPVDDDTALEYASRAFAEGEREAAAPFLLELLHRDPEHAANAIEALFENEQTAAPAGFIDVRFYGPGVAKLQLELARNLDARGSYGAAARFYAKSGSRDPKVIARRGVLTTAQRCETCGGIGKVRSPVTCPTCGGSGTVVCHVCSGLGYTLVPGSPPCTNCGGSGQIVQNGRTLTCGVCGGTGKSKASVIRKTCTHCVQGRETCPNCLGGYIYVMKECPDCHGRGVRALADN